MKTTALLLLAVIFAGTVTAQSPHKVDWNADMDFLVSELSEKHYDFFTIRSKDDLREGIERIKSQSPRLNDFRTALKVQQLLAGFGDSHTRLDFFPLLDRSQALPLGLSWTSDGIYILHTTSANKELLGRRIEAIDGVPIRTVIDSLSTLLTIDNQAIVKSIIPQLIPSLQILEHFGFTHSQQAQLTLDDGSLYPLQAIGTGGNSPVSFEPDSVCYAAENRKRIFTDRYFPDQKIYYMLYNSCTSREIETERGNHQKAAGMPSFAEFEQRALSMLESEPVEKLIFDMRFNGGGSSAQGTRFVEKLAEALEKNPHLKIYVVIGRNTFSSAILNAMDFKRLTDATFVGEQTAGKPNHFGEVRSSSLPCSGLEICYSTKYFKRSDQEVNTLTPDVTLEESFADFVRGTDPVFEWIRRQ